jgi:CheY-like chemotaxis protein
MAATDVDPCRVTVETAAGKWQVASDGLAAVQKAEELQPDLILLDIGLPKLNGIEAARQIHKLSPVSKIVAMSQEASAEDDNAVEGKARGPCRPRPQRSKIMLLRSRRDHVLSLIGS